MDLLKIQIITGVKIGNMQKRPKWQFESLVAELMNACTLAPCITICHKASIGILEFDIRISTTKPAHVHQHDNGASAKVLSNPINGIGVHTSFIFPVNVQDIVVENIGL